MSDAAPAEHNEHGPAWSFNEIKQMAYLLMLEQNGNANKVSRLVLAGEEHDAYRALHKYYNIAKNRILADVAEDGKKAANLR